MNCYAGIDLHSNNAYLAVIDETGAVKVTKKLTNNLNTILLILKRFKEELAGVVVESTFNWYWLVDGLQEAGYCVYLANPSAIKQYDGLKHTDDKSDATWLAEMLRLNILPTGYIYPKHERSLRDLLRKRTLLMRHRTALMISLKGFIHNWTGTQVSRNILRQLTSENLTEMFDDTDNIESSRRLNNVIAAIDTQVREIEQNVFERIPFKKKYQNLQTVWGIGQMLASTIILETGDIRRFSNAGRYASYCRCVASKKISNEKKKGSGNKKNGNKYLSWAYLEAAYFMKRFYPEARAWFDKKCARRGTTVAMKALSNKIARACYFIMRDQTVFNSSRLFA